MTIPSLRTLALGLTLLAAGCRASPHPLVSEDAVMLHLPILHQDELYECGLVAIDALCTYYEVEIPRETRAELAALAVEREGLSGEELRGTLDALGFETYLFAGTLDRSATGLYGHVDKGRPLIVLVSRDGGTHHYCLVLGYDETYGNVYLLDPLRGQIVLPALAFERTWERSSRFALLALPRTPDPVPK